MTQLDKTLARQLDKLNLSFEKIPSSVVDWQEFLLRVHKTYLDFEHDRYLTERSMAISSEELINLNNTLELSQHIAKLGYWYYDIKNQYSSCSKELYNLFCLNYVEFRPNLDRLYSFINPQDVEIFKNNINSIMDKNTTFTCEIRVKCENHYNWFKVTGSNQDGLNIFLIFRDIQKDKMTESKIKELNEKIVAAARNAGMAEVATSILHNIGNVLNSAYVSNEILKEDMLNTSISKFSKLMILIHQHKENLEDFFRNDPKGKLIPEYCLLLNETFAADQQKILKEIDNLSEHLNHIKDIVAMQKYLTNQVALQESFDLDELIQKALKIAFSSQKTKEIAVKTKFKCGSQVIGDRAKVMQILINLIKNAIESVLAASNESKKIEIQSGKTANKVKVSIVDNGLGIDQKNMGKIFTFGFTTKKEGHGFGLHNSALAAKELGGEITFKSTGLNKGANFILQLPLNSRAKNEST